MTRVIKWPLSKIEGQLKTILKSGEGGPYLVYDHEIMKFQIIEHFPAGYMEIRGDGISIEDVIVSYMNWKVRQITRRRK